MYEDVIEALLQSHRWLHKFAPPAGHCWQGPQIPYGAPRSNTHSAVVLGRQVSGRLADAPHAYLHLPATVRGHVRHAAAGVGGDGLRRLIVGSVSTAASGCGVGRGVGLDEAKRERLRSSERMR